MEKLRIVLVVLIVSLLLMTNAVSCKKNDQVSSESNNTVTAMTPSVATSTAEVVNASALKITETPSSSPVAIDTLSNSPEQPIVEVASSVLSDSVAFASVATVEDVSVESPVIVEDVLSDVVYLAPSFEMGTLTFHNDGSITDYYRYGMAVQAKVTISSDCLIITYSPATITGDDIEAFINGCGMEYPELASQVTYEIKPEEIVFRYAPEMMGGKYYKLLTLDYLNNKITKALDEANHVDAVYVSVNENDEKIFSTEFQLFGKECYILATNTWAEIHSGSPFTTEELEMIVGVCLAVNSDLQYAKYSIDGECMKVTYPAVDDLYIKNVVSSINNLICAYTPVAIPLLEEIPVEAVVDYAVIGDIVEESSAEDVRKEIVLEETPATPVITIVERPVDTVVPVTEKGKKVSLNTKLGVTTGFANSRIDLGLSVEGEASINKHFAVGLKTGYNLVSGSVPFIPYVKGSIGNAYLQTGAGFAVAPFDSFKVAGLFELGIGYEFPLEEKFSVFAEAGVRVSLNGTDKPTIGGFAIVGGNIKF